MFPLLLLTLEVWNIICNSFNLIFVPPAGEILTKSDDPNLATQNFEFFDKHSVNHVNHFWRIVGSILKEILRLKQLIDGKTQIARLSPLIISKKITVAWHVYPG